MISVFNLRLTFFILQPATEYEVELYAVKNSLTSRPIKGSVSTHESKSRSPNVEKTFPEW